MGQPEESAGAQIHDDPHWTPDELASFVYNPGIGRILSVRASAPGDSAVEQWVREAGYTLGRLPVTRDPSHLPQAAATFAADVIYLAITQPLDLCLNALEVLSSDPKTQSTPIVALVPDYVSSKVIEEAYTRSGCDFFRLGATQIELLARTHLLVRLSARHGLDAALSAAPIPRAANDPMGSTLELRDPETGVYAPTYLRHRLPIETARAHRYQRALSIIATRAQSAAASEENAGKVARSLQRACRNVDLVARLEPDLFLVLLPETDHPGAEIVVQRITDDLEAQTIEHQLGLATLGGEGEHAAHSASELLHLACKRAG